jgi:hypothetical protein
MNLEKRLTKLEEVLAPKKEYPAYISLTHEEYQALNGDNATTEEKEAILIRHKVWGLNTGIKTYAVVSPNDWDE